jgi:hypothetical protein|tara:strand:+ start:611 stop:1195 length:585 start_codon:yes stop_codon:yes gene_type:complete
MKFVRIFIFVLFNTLILMSFTFKLVNSAEIITIKANEARLYFGGLFPSYIFYMQGGIPEDTASAWVDKEYWAVLEIDESSKVHGGESTIFKLKRSSKASPQPEWCVTEGGAEFAGKGPACLKTPADPKSMNQLRFKVKVQYSETAENLPTEFQNKNWVQYEVGYDEDEVSLNKLPGRLAPPNHTFGPVTLYIFK